MPKRKLVKPPEEVLDAIKQAHQHGAPMPKNSGREILSYRYRVQTPELPFSPAVGKLDSGKKGELRIWEPGQPKGPGKLHLPLNLKLQEMEREFLTEAAKRRRRPPTEAAANAKRANSKWQKVEAAWRQVGLNTPGATKKIAAQLHLSISYVNKVRRKMRQSEGNK